MQITLILLPIIAYILLTFFFTQKTNVSDFLEAIVKGHLVIFVFIAITVEILSLFNTLTFTSVLTAWLLFVTVCLVVSAKRYRTNGFSLPKLRIDSLTGILVGVIALILAVTFVTAIVYPPNNWDSMTYHMPRVAHWLSNNNVSFYPTGIIRQNYQMPLSEFAIMHLQVLTGIDLFANLVQWMSFLILICLGFLMAAEFGLSDRQRLMSAMFIATLPMAILQASSTQNDLVVSSFVMAFALFMLRLQNTQNAGNLFFAALALGLALLTKGTAYLFCAAIGTFLGIPMLLKHKSKKIYFLKTLFSLSFVVIIALVLNVGHFTRNYKLYGHPLSTEDIVYRNKDISTAVFLANIVRNGALHLGTPSNRINDYIYSAMYMTLGAQLNNPTSTWSGASFRIRCSRHEDAAGNLIHMLICLLCIPLLPMLLRQEHESRVKWYTISIILGVALYCWVLKWQPWASRLHTPLFAMIAPLFAMTMAVRINGVGKLLSHILIFCLALYSLFFVFDNKSRSLVSLDWYFKDRMELYFTNRPNLFQNYKNAIDVVLKAKPQKVGLYLGVDDWEYPFWAFAMKAKKNVNFRHVGISNISKNIEEEKFLPLYVITTREINNWEPSVKYVSVYTSDIVSVFKKSEYSQ